MSWRAIALRHPEVYRAVFCASRGAGYQPPDVMPTAPPRTYLVAGTLVDDRRLGTA
jgi:hypothetical protein